MKNLIHFSMTSLLLFASCNSWVYDDSDSSSQPTKDVMFVIKGITEEYSTRATIESVGCTDLYVWEDSTLLSHQTSTDADFGTPTVSLTYGSHDITFIASSSKSQSWADGVWSTTKPVDDYSAQMNVTVSGNSSSSRQVQLDRRNSRITFVTEDKVPTSVTQCHLNVQTCFSLDADLSGCNPDARDVTLDISSYQGKTYSVFVNALTVSATDEEDCAVTIEFLDSSSNILYHYDRTVKLKPNRNTNLKGNYFSGEANAISLNTEWLDELTTEL